MVLILCELIYKLNKSLLIILIAFFTQKLDEKILNLMEIYFLIKHVVDSFSSPLLVHCLDKYILIENHIIGYRLCSQKPYYSHK